MNPCDFNRGAVPEIVLQENIYILSQYIQNSISIDASFFYLRGNVKMKWPAKRSFSGPSRWDPFEEIRRTQERLNQLFEDFMPMEEWGGGKVYTPAIDIKEEEDKLLVTTDLPGINKEDVEINLKEDMLEISAKASKEKESEEEGYLRKERSYTQFYRAVRLPVSIREEGSSAKMENGVLTISLPKVKIEEPKKKIDIE